MNNKLHMGLMERLRRFGLTSPRMWLFIWGGLGALFLAYVLLTAAVQRAGRPGAPRDVAATAANHDPGLLTGEMADFEYTMPVRAAPDAMFDYEGELTSLAAFRGSAVLLNLWATWCAPCLKELPSLDALEASLGGADFKVVAVAADPRGPDAAREYLERLEIENLELFADPRLQLASALGGAAALPVSILYDASGNEVGRLVGEANWSSDEAKALVNAVVSR